MTGWVQDGGPHNGEKNVAHFLISNLGLCPFFICHKILDEPLLQFDAGYVVFQNDRSVYFPKNLLQTDFLNSAELMFQALCQTKSLLSSASFVVSLSLQLAQFGQSRPLNRNQLVAWATVAERCVRCGVIKREFTLTFGCSDRFHNLTGNPVFISTAACAERKDLQSVVYTASHFLYVRFGGSNAAVEKFLQSVAKAPWKIDHGTFFWKRCKSTLLRADIPIIEKSVLHYHSAWTESQSVTPHMLLDGHTGIFFTKVDWHLLILLLLFSDMSILKLPGQNLQLHGVPSQLADAHGVLTQSDYKQVVPPEYTV